MRQGLALVLSAPSGAGKSTLARMLLKEFPSLDYSISCTTRPMRSGEIHGKDYYFLTREEFETRRSEGDFAEWAEVHGYFYGTPLKPVKKMLSEGKDALFDVDVQGGAQIKNSLPGACLAFILPPSLEELERRLKSRDLDDAATIQRRMLKAADEISQARWYDALILNDDLASAYDNLRAVYLAATLAPGRNQQMLEKLLI